MSIKTRQKVSACFNDFTAEINRLQKFDFTNQQKFTAGELSKAQIELMVESIFFTAFRNYENFVREIFLLYCMEKNGINKLDISSYLKPKNFEHTEHLIKSSMQFLDWTSPEQIIQRAELYLKNGYPMKLPYTSNLQQLKDYKKLRNHIAHNSLESETQYEKVVRTYYNGVRPVSLPSPGKYLMLSSRSNNGNYLLLDFFALMKKLSTDLT